MDTKFSFLFQSSDDQRKAYRATFAKLSIIIDDESFQIQNLSISGLSFIKRPDKKMPAPSTVTASLAIGSKVYLKDVPLSILRITKSIFVACCFTHLTLQQELSLDKLILEMQKRSIARIKNET